MVADLLPCVEIGPPAARAAVIWLHGLGADGHDFEPVVPHLGLDPALAVRFVFPHAPSIPVTINGGLIMPAWYDIRTLELGTFVDREGIRRSADRLRALVARENGRGIPCGRIVLAGFSQGGAIALHVALRDPERFAGALALSTYLVGEEGLDSEAHEANRGLEVFQGHGRFDPMVPVEYGEAARERLEALGCRVTWRTYPMEHQVCMEEIAEIGSWLAERFPPSP